MTRHLQKRGRIYHYRFKVGGREYTGTTEAADLQTAKVVLEQVRRDTILGDHGFRKAPSLQALAEEWMDTRGRAVSASHLRAARQSFESMTPLHRLPLTHITTARVDDWRADYLQGHSPASANLCLRYLKLWMHWALAEKVIKEVPYTIKPLRVQQRERPVARVPHDFLEAIRAKHRNPQVPAAVAFAMMLGLRESEVLGATWAHLKDGVYTVQGKTKSKKIRKVPVPPEVMTELGRMICVKGGPLPLPTLGLVFPGTRGKRHVQGWLRQALKRGGIDGLGMHRLRATFVTLHLSSGTDLKTVQEMAGHADPRTTLIYQETTMEQKAERQAGLWKKA